MLFRPVASVLMFSRRDEEAKYLLSEERFPTPLLEVLKETGAKVHVIGHVATGDYTREKFENEMKVNADTLVRALVTESP